MIFASSQNCKSTAYTSRKTNFTLFIVNFADLTRGRALKCFIKTPFLISKNRILFEHAIFPRTHCSRTLFAPIELNNATVILKIRVQCAKRRNCSHFFTLACMVISLLLEKMNFAMVTLDIFCTCERVIVYFKLIKEKNVRIFLSGCLLMSL